MQSRNPQIRHARCVIEPLQRRWALSLIALGFCQTNKIPSTCLSDTKFGTVPPLSLATGQAKFLVASARVRQLFAAVDNGTNHTNELLAV